MNKEQKLMRIGAACAIMGVLIATISAMLGPRDLNFDNIHVVLQTFDANFGQLKIHGLGVSLGTLLILGSFVGLRWSITNGSAEVWARLGLVAAIVKTGVHLTGAMMGGSVIPAFAGSYMLLGETSDALWVGRGLYIFYEALLAPTFLTLATTILLFGIAVLKADNYPVWLGWLAIGSSIWTAAGWIAFVVVGPIEAADVMLIFIPGFMMSMIWLFITGIYMWQNAKIPSLE
jgi:hypothetical protein